MANNNAASIQAEQVNFSLNIYHCCKIPNILQAEYREKQKAASIEKKEKDKQDRWVSLLKIGALIIMVFPWFNFLPPGQIRRTKLRKGKRRPRQKQQREKEELKSGPKIFLLFLQKRLFQRNLGLNSEPSVIISDCSHVPVNMFSVLATRTCQVFLLALFFCQNFPSQS